MISLVAINLNARSQQTLLQSIDELTDFQLLGCFSTQTEAARSAANPQIVIADISSDPLLLTQLRENRYGDEIIALMNPTDSSVLPSLLRSGIADCLVKPITATRLYYTLTFLQKRLAKSSQAYSQQQLDDIFLRLNGVGGIAYALQKTDKGINSLTLQRIWHLLQQSGTWHSIADLTVSTRLSAGAVCKYLRYLKRQDLVQRRFRQGPYGRPRLEVMAFEPLSGSAEANVAMPALSADSPSTVYKSVLRRAESQ